MHISELILHMDFFNILYMSLFEKMKNSIIFSFLNDEASKFLVFLNTRELVKTMIDLQNTAYQGIFNCMYLFWNSCCVLKSSRCPSVTTPEYSFLLSIKLIFGSMLSNEQKKAFSLILEQSHI